MSAQCREKRKRDKQVEEVERMVIWVGLHGEGEERCREFKKWQEKMGTGEGEDGGEIGWMRAMGGCK